MLKALAESTGRPCWQIPANPSSTVTSWWRQYLPPVPSVHNYNCINVYIHQIWSFLHLCCCCCSPNHNIVFSLARKNPLTLTFPRQPRQNRTSWWTVLTPTRHVGTDAKMHTDTHTWLIRHFSKCQFLCHSSRNSFFSLLPTSNHQSLSSTMDKPGSRFTSISFCQRRTCTRHPDVEDLSW